MPAGALAGVLGSFAQEGLGTIFQDIRNKDAAKINEEYGERAAGRAQNRAEKFYDSRLSPHAVLTSQLEAIREYGLSEGLLMSQGGISGSGGTPTQIQGTTGGAHPGQAGNANMAGNIQQGMIVDMQLKRQQAEIDNIEADTANKRANTKTTDEQRAYIVETARQSGIEKWLQNGITNYMLGGGDGIEAWRNSNLRSESGISPNSIQFKQKIAEIAEIQGAADNQEAQAALADENKKLRFAEILIGQMIGNAAATEAAAHKLAAEFNYGEEANWKWWVQQGQETLGSLSNVFNVSKSSNKTKGTNTNTNTNTNTSTSTSNNTTTVYRGK